MVRAAPAEILDDPRHVGPDDAVLVVVPAWVAGEVLADLRELPAGWGDGQPEDQGQGSEERSHGGLHGTGYRGCDGWAGPSYSRRHDQRAESLARLQVAMRRSDLLQWKRLGDDWPETVVGETLVDERLDPLQVRRSAGSRRPFRLGGRCRLPSEATFL